MLDHQDRIGAARQHAAGGDRRRDAGDDRLLVGTMPGASTSSLSSRVRGVSSIAPNVSLGLHREAVDVGAIEAGNVDVRDDIVGEHAVAAPRASGTVSVPSGASRRCSRKRAVASSRVTTLRNCVWPDSGCRGLSTGWLGMGMCADAQSYRYTVTSVSGP